MVAESHERPAAPTPNDDNDNAIPRQFGTERTDDLRQLDNHHSYKEVFYACEVYSVGHE